MVVVNVKIIFSYRTNHLHYVYQHLWKQKRTMPIYGFWVGHFLANTTVSTTWSTIKLVLSKLLKVCEHIFDTASV